MTAAQPSPRSDTDRRSDTTRRSILHTWSIEATLPSAQDIATLGELLPPGTRVYLSALPHGSPMAQLEAAAGLRAVGLEPVPHLSARNFESREQLDLYLETARARAAVRRYLVVGGDLDRPRGPFATAFDIVADVPLRRYGVVEIGVAGYPDGHPRIAGRDLAAALRDKLAAATGAGLSAHVVTQFCFDAEPIARWVLWLRSEGIDAPLRIGLAGPASARALLTFAMKCGVKAPFGGLGRKLDLAGRLLRSVDPAGIVEALDAQDLSGGDYGAVSAHFFSFGGIQRTAKWVLATRDALGHTPASDTHTDNGPRSR